jgi:hypothetical protein
MVLVEDPKHAESMASSPPSYDAATYKKDVKLSYICICDYLT